MEEFDTLDEVKNFVNSGRMRLLYLSRPACGVCTALKPKIISIIDEFREFKGAYVDMDKIPESAGEYSIFTIPGILVFIDGKEMIREARFVSAEELESRIDRFYHMIYD